MYWDVVLNVLLNLRDPEIKEDGGPFFIQKKFHNNNSRVLKVIIPPWGDKKYFITKKLIQRLHKKGYATIEYLFPKYILSVKPKNTLAYFEIIKNQIRSDITTLKKKHSFEKIDIIAPSLGVVSACLIANGNKDISNLFFIVPGSCLASSLWNGIRTKKLRSAYEKQGMHEQALITLWAQVAPKNNVDSLHDKHIFISISHADKIIPYRFGKEFADLLLHLYPQSTTIHVNTSLGHYLTTLVYYMFKKIVLT